jgi:hypothetical protein
MGREVGMMKKKSLEELNTYLDMLPLIPMLIASSLFGALVMYVLMIL